MAQIQSGATSDLLTVDPTSKAAFPDPPTTTITTDMDVFLGMFISQYFKLVYEAVKANTPHHLLSGPDPMDPTARAQVIQAMLPYVDLVLFATNSSPASQAARTAFYNTYGIPCYASVYITAQPDSQFAQSPSPYDPSASFPTQNAKGVSYADRVTGFFNAVGNDGYGYHLGVDYWQYTDNSSEKGAYGLVSLNDNLYNGIESCGKSIKDPWGFTTTPEPTTGCYGDFITPVKAANRIWLGPGLP